MTGFTAQRVRAPTMPLFATSPHVMFRLGSRRAFYPFHAANHTHAVRRMRAAVALLHRDAPPFHMHMRYPLYGMDAPFQIAGPYTSLCRYPSESILLELMQTIGRSLQPPS